ncbi:hypothetical protein [Mycobacterium sp. VKM Ac-1816D]|uniref:hypothetical protein n=1 Tax=Mycobacterium sp. VKM Ac-1816D TaxID=1273686 RepID=UPI0003F7CC06|nr:hypothetical protein [Mycobacterium sp. VKM Ac-1816D]
MTDQHNPTADIEIRQRKRWPWIASAAGLVAVVIGGIVYSQTANRDQPFGTELEVATWSTDIAAENLLAYISENIAPEHGITIKPVQIDNLIESTARSTPVPWPATSSSTSRS